MVPRAFSEGKASEADYARLLRVRSPCVVFDSEVLHRGAATGGVSLATAALSPAITTPSPATTTIQPHSHHHPDRRVGQHMHGATVLGLGMARAAL